MKERNKGRREKGKKDKKWTNKEEKIEKESMKDRIEGGKE